MKRVLVRLGLLPDKDRDPHASRHTIHIGSSADGTRQPCLFVPCDTGEPRPLLVYLHPWRHGYDTDSRRWQQEAHARNWHFIAPHFRGPNKRPEACASRLARQDVIDAVDFVRARCGVDERRIYVAGVSGGAHMALIMAADAPDLWAAVTAWCPVTDLAAFYRECVAQNAKVYRHIAKCCGGAPGSSPQVDRELRYRSPVHHMVKAKNVAIDINHGIRDGRPRGIGVQHSVWAFNALAAVLDGRGVDDSELADLQNVDPPPVGGTDPVYGRAIYLRRTAGPSRLTIFDGGHEDLPAAGCAWLDAHERPRRETAAFETR